MAFTCSKSTMEALEKFAKFVQRHQKDFFWVPLQYKKIYSTKITWYFVVTALNQKLRIHLASTRSIYYLFYFLFI